MVYPQASNADHWSSDQLRVTGLLEHWSQRFRTAVATCDKAPSVRPARPAALRHARSSKWQAKRARCAVALVTRALRRGAGKSARGNSLGDSGVSRRRCVRHGALARQARAGGR